MSLVGLLAHHLLAATTSQTHIAALNYLAPTGHTPNTLSQTHITSISTHQMHLHNVRLIVVLLAHLASPGVGQSYNSLPGLYVDLVTVFGPNSTKAYYNSTTQSSLGPIPHSSMVYSMSWGKQIGPVLKSALSLHNYQIQTVHSLLSYTIELLSPNSTGTTLVLDVLDPTAQLTFLTFNVIVLTSANNFIDLVIYSNNFSYLSDPARSNSFEQFTASSASLYFGSASQTKVSAHLQWIAFNPQTDYIQVYSFGAAVVVGSSLINITFSSDVTHTNSLASFKLSLLVVNAGEFVPNVASYSTFFSQTNTSLAAGWGVPGEFVGAISQNCVFLLSTLSRHYDQPDTTLYFTINNQLVSGITQNQNDYFDIQLVCYIQCPYYAFLDPHLTSAHCQLCSDFIPNCITCSSQSNCILCNSISYLSSDSTSCTPCQSAMQYCQTCLGSTVCLSCLVGRLVGGGCTKVVGCIETVQMGIPIISVCSKCEAPSFVLNQTSKVCECSSGRLVGNYCTLDPGCVSTYLSNRSVLCNHCSIAQQFVLDPANDTCVCTDGFYLTGGQCREICGDGRVYSLQCDDGNSIDGDGCSSNCSVEMLYRCNNSKTRPSICQYVGLSIKVALVSSQKVQGANQGVFTFQFSPKLLNLAKLDLSSYFHFSCPGADYSVDHWSYSEGQAKLYLNYSTSLQGLGAGVNFTFDGSYVKYAAIQVAFSVRGKGMKLQVQGNSGVMSGVGYYLYTLSILAYLLLLFGSLLNRMIGAELLQTLQIVYLCHFAAPNYTQQISIFQYLALVGLNDRFFHEEYMSLAYYPAYQILPFSAHSAQTTVMMVGIVLGCCLGLAQLLQPYPCFKLTLHQLNRLRKVRQLAVSNWIFPVGVSLTYPLFLLQASLVHTNVEASFQFSQGLRSFLMLLQTMLYSVIVCDFIKHFLKKGQQQPLVQDCKEGYLPIYVLLMYLKLAVVWVWLRLGLLAWVYGLLGLFLLQLLWQIVYKPYHRLLYNIGINLNVCSVLVFLLYLTLNQIAAIEQSNIARIAFMLFILALLTLCVLLSFIRVALTIKKRLQTQKEQSNRDVEASLRSKPSRLYTQSKRPMLTALHHYHNYLETDNKDQLCLKQQKTLDQQFLKLLRKKRHQFSQKKVDYKPPNQKPPFC